MKIDLHEAMVKANKRYDEALKNYASQPSADGETAILLRAAGEEMDKAIDAFRNAINEEHDKHMVDLLMAVGNVNRNADRKDVNRNHTNYGISVKCADTLRLFGHQINLPVYENEGYLRIPNVTIDGKDLDTGMDQYNEPQIEFIGNVWVWSRGGTLIETRRIYREDLRRLCIDQNWYTRGNNEEYSQMLDEADNCENVTTEVIVSLAENILRHSTTEQSIESICFDITKKCHSFFRSTAHR
jgi:hypothetical protein